MMKRILDIFAAFLIKFKGIPLAVTGVLLIVVVAIISAQSSSRGVWFEAESGSNVGDSSIVADSTAASGQAVAFTQSAGCPAGQTGTPPNCTTPPVDTCPTAKHTPGGDDGMGGCWPGPHNTGVPSSITLTAYTGPCTITAANTVIDSKTINCNLNIQATNVVIKNSRINGRVINSSTNYSFSLIDSEVIGPQGANPNDDYTGVAEYNFTMLRVEVTGGNRSVYCHNTCDVRDSYTHGQNIVQNVRVHASGFRQSQNGVIVHNALTCDVADTPAGGGCSASLTGYGDFEPVKNNLLEKNLFVASTGGACAYGGSSGDDGAKPYGHLAENIRFIDNIFQRGPGGKCGFYFPITDFDSSRPGNIWSNNKFDNGVNVPPAN